MDQTCFEQWLAHVDELTDAQRRQVRQAMGRRSPGDISRAAVERNLGEDRRCPHCHTPKARIHGTSRGLRRYRCRSCRRTFSATTGTPRHGLHRKERWLRFRRSLARGESLRRAAQRCQINADTAFRWRHRFLQAAETVPERLQGIVEVDETYRLESRKGQEFTDRPPRRRGGRAVKRGRSAEPVPILVATDRSGSTCSEVLPGTATDAIAPRLGNWVDPDAMLVSDGYATYAACARLLGLRHEAINLSAGRRVRGAVHIQTVNSRHSQWKSFLHPFRGVSTRYLGNDLRLYHLTTLAHRPVPRTYMAAIISNSSTRFPS